MCLILKLPGGLIIDHMPIKLIFSGTNSQLYPLNTSLTHCLEKLINGKSSPTFLRSKIRECQPPEFDRVMPSGSIFFCSYIYFEIF